LGLGRPLRSDDLKDKREEERIEGRRITERGTFALSRWDDLNDKNKIRKIKRTTNGGNGEKKLKSQRIPEKLNPERSSAAPPGFSARLLE